MNKLRERVVRYWHGVVLRHSQTDMTWTGHSEVVTSCWCEDSNPRPQRKFHV